MEGRWLKIVVAVSLVINVFAIGAVAGLLLAPTVRPHMGPPPMGSITAADRLSSESRDGFRQTIFDANQATGPLALDAHVARRELIRLMKAQPFDRAAATAAMARARSDDQQVRAHLDESVIGFVAKLNPSERSILADGFRHVAQQRREARQFDSPPPGPDGHN